MCKPLSNCIAQTKQRPKHWAGGGGGRDSKAAKGVQRVHISLWHTSADNVVARPYTVIHISYTSNSPFQKMSFHQKPNFLYVFGGGLYTILEKLLFLTDEQSSLN